MNLSRDMVLRERRGRVEDAYRNIAAVSLVILLLCGCSTPDRYHEPTQAEIEAEARAVNAIHKQLKEGR